MRFLQPGLVHLLVTAAATHGSVALAAFIASRAPKAPGEDRFRREEIPADLITLPPKVSAMYAALTGLVSRRVIHSFTVQRADERADHYRENPIFVRLLADHLATMTGTPGP